MKKLICLYMGQAAVADMDEYNFYSGQFSSCCPIFMFNDDMKTGGYYHMPGKTDQQNTSILRLDRADEKIVGEMINNVEPTKIWVFPGGSVVCGIQTRVNMKSAMGALAVARGMTNTVVEVPEEARNNLSVTLRDGSPDFGRTVPAYKKCYDSKRDQQKAPPSPPILFWNWDIDTRNWVVLS